MQEGHVVEYKAHKWKEHEEQYLAYDIELTTIVRAFKIWRHYLLRKNFILMTDHSSLTNLFHQLNLNSHQARWTVFLSEFDFDKLSI